LLAFFSTLRRASEILVQEMKKRLTADQSLKIREELEAGPQTEGISPGDALRRDSHSSLGLPGMANARLWKIRKTAAQNAV
jgi:hypothetical protein